ncbi:hypothetical protein ABZP36_009152 [Zizania latifolia]
MKEPSEKKVPLPLVEACLPLPVPLPLAEACLPPSACPPPLEPCPPPLKPCPQAAAGWWRTNCCHDYFPQKVSLGPFHHGDDVLLPMETHKRRAVVQLVKRSGKLLQEFIAAVEEISDQLYDAYENLDETWHQDQEQFVELMAASF